MTRKSNPQQCAAENSDSSNTHASLTPRERGFRCENLVCRFLQERGLALLERNARRRVGEIDLVMFDARTATVVLVEVRFRHRANHGSALASVTPAKQRRLRRAALAWLANHQRLHEPARIDVVGVCPRGIGETDSGLAPTVVDALECTARRDGAGMLQFTYRGMRLSWIINAIAE